ncbi:hypothetical protein EW146_g2731 [Bondarzewia mesenterica]|uniref:Pheromone-processing carboxypeptidase KEX1 n=1 Tax=Bondarzewia mesenterica TaxID=1095465 RepID=A0A4S4LZN8_9AGAM|nr:hypothetical protein EW146_g2731 [Bondarzewia mesenterica]
MHRSRYSRVLCALLSGLLYAPFAHAAPTDIPSAASFYVPNLPDLHQNEAHPLHIFAGHLSADPDVASLPATAVTAHLYFVLVKARRTADRERILFWFNASCSSFDGLMMEIGPWRVDGKGGLKTVEGGWEEYTTVVYVDQPAGTGFSYTSTDRYVHELDEASQQFIEFLRNFYIIFPEYKRMDTYIGGESFAGQYIPYFSDAVLKSNLNVPLRGAAIGNGWIDARRQYPSFLDYAVKHGIIEENSENYEKGKKAVDECNAALKNIEDEPINVNVCEQVMGVVSEVRNRNVDGRDVCMNIYDVRLNDDQPACGMNWPPDLKNITTYLRRQDVVGALHAQAKSESWTECQTRIHRELRLRNSPSSITVLPRVLEKIPVMIFAGDQDFICNYIGLESMIQAMTWNGETGLGKVETQTWTVGGQPAGTWVSSRNLTYTKIFNASHMVGFDVPHVSHDMILRFMGVNFSAITDGSARIPSSVGDDSKPAFIDDALPAASTPVPVSKTPEQDKAMWEAYYNAGSAAVILVIICIALAVFFWYRVRRRRLRGLPVSANDEEESIPLTQSGPAHDGNDGIDETNGFRGRMGKGKERAEEAPAIFDVGDSDEDEPKSARGVCANVQGNLSTRGIDNVESGCESTSCKNSFNMTNQYLAADSAIRDDNEGELKGPALGLVNAPKSASLRQPEIYVTRRDSAPEANASDDNPGSLYVLGLDLEILFLQEVRNCIAEMLRQYAVRICASAFSLWKTVVKRCILTEIHRVFLLVDEGTVRKYKADLRDEIEPQINELITRAEKGLKGLLKKESLLQVRVEAAQSRSTSRAGSGTTTSNKLEYRRHQMLTKQRERLEEELRQLESEVLTLASASYFFPRPSE